MNGFGEGGQDDHAREKDELMKAKRFWFSGLTEEEQDRILSPHFEAANPTDEDKQRRRQEYEEW
tara:strand:- start:189 stop:380 length:192 start_codon:yes stop_codon:yes gene_type:complete